MRRRGRALRRRYGRAGKPRAGKIVLAWRSDGTEVVDPHMTRIDLGERHKSRNVVQPHAVMWLNKGTEQDVVKAEAHALKERTQAEGDPYRTGYGHRVFVYPSAERDPLGRARKDILQ
jgi:hypothetical protein